MGGYGSGRLNGAWPKETVEDCLVLAAAKLQRDKLLKAGMYASGTLTWTRVSTGEQTASVGYNVNTVSGQRPTINLYYTTTRRADGQNTDADYPVGLTTTPLPWGGLRFWFCCPLTRNGRPCGRRVGKLYLPPDGRYFGCRHCHDLTYRSTRRPPLPEVVRMMRMDSKQLRRYCRRQIRKIERDQARM